MAAYPKKIVNSTEECVEEMMEGLSIAFPGLLRLHPNYRKIVFSKLQRPGLVSLLSGGGAGHEPFSAGYVGEGMLSAAVSGSIFASPPSSQIFESIQLLSVYNDGAGVFVIIPNYTGDRLNFGLAIEKAQRLGLKVESIIVGEDCAHHSSEAEFAGRRGLCGLVLVFKIAGAMSLEGKSLGEIALMAKKVVYSMSTIGVCLSPCILPDGSPSFPLEDNEIAVGVGVHGEIGIAKVELCSAKEIVSLMLEKINASLYLKPHDEVVVVVNNLGSTTQMEQWISVKEVHSQLSTQSIKVLRTFGGHIMTSLTMSGVQVCVLRCKAADEENVNFLRWLDVPTNAPAWPGRILSAPIQAEFAGSENLQINTVPYINLQEEMKNRHLLPKVDKNDSKMIRCCIEAAIHAIINEENKINILDTECGDGDCGTTLRRGAEGILAEIDTFPMECPSAMMLCLAAACEPHMAGTAGGIYSLLFTTCYPPLATLSDKMERKKVPWADAWARAWRSGLNGILKYCGAKVGDRTLLDVLEPACTKYELAPKRDALELSLALDSALEAAEKGCIETQSMTAKVGRASYVDAKHLHGYDAGAYGTLVWLRAVIGVLKKHFS